MSIQLVHKLFVWVFCFFSSHLVWVVERTLALESSLLSVCSHFDVLVFFFFLFDQIARWMSFTFSFSLSFGFHFCHQTIPNVTEIECRVYLIVALSLLVLIIDIISHCMASARLKWIYPNLVKGHSIFTNHLEMRWL